MKSRIRDLAHTLQGWNLLFLAVAVVLGMALCCSSTLAQSGAGSIQGTVTDATGAVIPGASIHAVNEATGVAANTKTNGVGFYQVPGLFTGSYTVTISAPGMKTYKQAIELLVAQNAVINASMTVGSVTQQVVSSANLVQLTTTDSGAVTSTLENARINQLPMNGRDLITLTNETTPGLVSCNQSSNCNDSGDPNQWCRAPFLNNQIPINRLSPVAGIINAITPQPTTAANPLVTDNLSARNPSFTVAPNITFRLDHSFNENNRAYLRYTSELTTNNSLRSGSQPATLAATVSKQPATG